MTRRKKSLNRTGGGRRHRSLMGLFGEACSIHVKISNAECFGLVLLEIKYHFTPEILQYG